MAQLQQLIKTVIQTHKKFAEKENNGLHLKIINYNRKENYLWHLVKSFPSPKKVPPPTLVPLTL